MHAVTDRPEAFSIRVAAEAFHVDRRQIDRDRKHGRFPNIFYDNGWRIPRTDLEAAGYKLDQRWKRRHEASMREGRRRYGTGS
jgi:hypothetical protein